MNTMINTKTLGQNIRNRRIFLKLTQPQLAALVGKSTRSIQQYEKGTITPSLQMLNSLTEALKTTPEVLLGYSKKEENPEIVLNPTNAAHLINAYNLACKVAMLRSFPEKVTVTLPPEQICCPICKKAGGMVQADGTRNQFCGNCGQALLGPDKKENTP